MGKYYRIEIFALLTGLLTLPAFIAFFSLFPDCKVWVRDQNAVGIVVGGMLFTIFLSGIIAFWAKKRRFDVSQTDTFSIKDTTKVTL